MKGNSKLLSLTIVSFLFSTNCERTPSRPDGDAITVDLSPRVLKLATNDTARFNVAVSDASGKLVTGKTITWSISDSTIIKHLGGGLIRGIREGQAAVQVEVEHEKGEAFVSVFDFLGRAVLENQTDHSAIKISCLPLGATEEQDYLPTDSLGYFVLPNLSDGQWVVRANYPYYKGSADTINVLNGKPLTPLGKLFLTQQVDFDVVLEKTTYSVKDTVWVAFKTTNLTADPITLETVTFPAFVNAVAFTRNGIPVLAPSWDYVIHFVGAPALDRRHIGPGETILENPPHVYDRIRGLFIDLPLLYKEGLIIVGASYHVYAAYPASITYSSEYFFPPAAYPFVQFSQLFNQSLYNKLKFVEITIIN